MDSICFWVVVYFNEWYLDKSKKAQKKNVIKTIKSEDNCINPNKSNSTKCRCKNHDSFADEFNKILTLVINQVLAIIWKVYNLLIYIDRLTKVE